MTTIRATVRNFVWPERDNRRSVRWPTVTRRFGAVLGPLAFSLAGGHLRSSLLQRPVDAAGNPIPWYTYPAVDFLTLLDVRGCQVAEVGAGNSTLWWAARADFVLALEPDPGWHRYLRDRTAALGNVDVRLVPTPEEFAAHITLDTYDIIVVDGGGDRPLHAQTAFARVKRSGMVIVDNANTGYGPPGRYPIIEAANAGGWLRVDFVGHCAGATRPSCTSLFFRPEVELLRAIRPPRVSQVRRA